MAMKTTTADVARRGTQPDDCTDAYVRVADPLHPGRTLLLEVWDVLTDLDEQGRVVLVTRLRDGPRVPLAEPIYYT